MIFVGILGILRATGGICFFICPALEPLEVGTFITVWALIGLGKPGMPFWMPGEVCEIW